MVYLLPFDVMILDTAHLLCRFLQVKGHKTKTLKRNVVGQMMLCLIEW